MLEKRFVKPVLQVLLWMFPVLFLVDNILGFNGYQFTIAGKSIRIILFCISVALLCGYCLFVMIQDKIALYSKDKEQVTVFKMLNPLDYLVMFFIFGNVIWATVVPLLVRGEMTFALKDYSTILVLVLYFPIAFLIRTGRLNLKLLEIMTYALIIVLALWHTVMYIGDTIHPGFYESYYDFIDIISFGTAVRTSVIYGWGIVRVIQTTSLFLLLGIFMALRYIVKGNWWHLISLALFTFAICVTYTKSIWFGYIIGLLLYLVPCIILKKEVRINSSVALAVAVSLILVFNYTVFDNTIFTRVFNTFQTSENVSSMSNELEQMQSSKPTASSKPVTSSKPTESSGSVASSKPTESSGSVASSKPTESSSSVASSKPTESSSSVASSKPTESSSSVVSSKPTESSSSVVSSKPTESSGSVVSSKPTESSKPVTSSTPATSSKPTTQAEKDKYENELKDAVGTHQANAIRAKQNSALLNKWKESKLVGFGYGSYTTECIRHSKYPYMYESTLPALMMKLGIVGCLVWVIFIGGTTIFAVSRFWKEKKENAFYWLGLALSYAMAVQTNPFLFTFAGFSMLLYLLVSVQKKTFPKK